MSGEASQLLFLCVRDIGWTCSHFRSCCGVTEVKSTFQVGASCLSDFRASMWTEHPAAPSGRKPTELEDVSMVVCGRSRSCHPKGMETVPLARLRLRVLPLDSVSSSPCSSDFLSAMLAKNRSVAESHSSGSSRSRNPRQMMQEAASRTTLKITSCFSTSTATRRQKETQTLGLII